MTNDDNNYQEKVIEVLRDYVQANRTHTATIERIYRNVTGDSIELSNYDEAEEAFSEIDWSDSLLLEYVDQVKQVVEKGENRVPETYFDIVEPDSFSLDYIKEQLSEPKYNPDKSGEEKEGFRIQIRDGKVHGRYVYIDVDTKLTFSGEIQPTTSDGFIQFEIDPDNKLLIIKSTSVIDIQKSRKYFDRKTSFEIAPSADYTTHTDGSVERINDFLSKFHDGIPSDGDEVPGLLQVDTIKLEDTSPESDDDEEETDGHNIENIQFEGHDIKNDDEVQSYLGPDTPWVIKKLEAEIYYKGEKFKVTIGTTGMMSYSKVSDSTDWDASTDLSQSVRKWFLEDLRIRSM